MPAIRVRCWLFVAWPAVALSQGGVATLRGTVLRDSTRTPLEGVEVRVDSTTVMRTTAQGTFALAGIAPGMHIVRARHAGYKPVELQLQLAPGETIDRTFMLTPLPVELPKVQVSARQRILSIHIQEFERRRQTGLGKFLTTDDFKGREASNLATVLRTNIPGLLVDPLSDGTVAVATRRGACIDFVSCTGRCYVQIFIDGQRVYHPPAGGGVGINPPPDLSRMGVSDILGVEVYKGPAETPLEFSGEGSACGTLVIWTGRKP